MARTRRKDVKDLDVIREITRERRPCAECPFLRTSPKGWLGPHESSTEILQLVHYDGKFPCHMAVNAISKLQDCDTLTAVEVAPHCAGSLAYRNNTLKRGADEEMAREMEVVGKRSDVFRTPMEVQLHHDGKIRPILPPGFPT